MNSGGTVASLKKSRFFKNIKSEDLEEIVKLGRLVELPADQVIFEEYDRAAEVYIILSGKVALSICEPKDHYQQIAILGDGELVGWSALLGKTRLSDTASTITPVRAVVFNGAELSKFCTDHPVFGVEFMKQAAAAMAIRLSGTRVQLLEMCGSHYCLTGTHLESD
jgi:CRP-like cAMP-binding protein